MRGTDNRASRVRNGRHTGLTEQPHVVSVYGGRQKVAGVEAAIVVPFFVDFARQFDDVHRLYRHAQRVDRIDAFEVGAGGFGVFTHPVR